jgi:hypothetical protein
MFSRRQFVVMTLRYLIFGPVASVAEPGNRSKISQAGPLWQSEWVAMSDWNSTPGMAHFG